MKSSKLAEPYDYIEVSIQSNCLLKDPDVVFYEVRVRNLETGQSSVSSIGHAEVTSNAVLAAIRKHKARLKRAVAESAEADA